MRVARRVTQQGFLDPTSAEALAVFLAIQQCQSSGVQKIIVEGDAQTIINAINTDGKHESRYRHIIEDIKILLLSFTEWQAQHVRRSENSIAHRLAKMATRNVIDKIWRDVAPDCISDIIQAEMSTSI